ncbi:MAG: TIGR00730 family Rossman fold protein, partial [Bdellovibrionales bacterium]|nr:TIGR00730 family Rossman fold protein [Bdellovibrionales bacterium]
AEGALIAGGTVLGVFPQLELGHEKAHEGLTEFINVQTMAERKQILFDKSDAFLVFPGGLGTLDEVFELITLRLLHETSPNKNLNMHKKPVIFVNTLNFWDPLLESLEIMIQQNFISRSLGQLFQVKEDLKEIVQLLANE